MKKTSNVKPTKLMLDNRIKVGGEMYRITFLTHKFGSSRNRVRIYARSIDDASHSINLEVCPKTRFTIYNQK